jgi:hypothetical protein
MKKIFLGLMAAAIVIISTCCSKESGNGRLVVNITDAPFPVEFVESANVTITKVEIRKAGDGICDSTPFSVIWSGSEVFNLLELRNGIVEELLDLEIPAGEYDLIRLYVEEASLKVKDGETFSVRVPGGQQTGIKLFISPGLFVKDGLTSELLLDFDLSESFRMQGNMDSPAGIKGFIFKPVIRAVNKSTAGTLQGTVTEVTQSGTVPVGDVKIDVRKDGVTVTSAISDSDAANSIDDGFYAISGLPSGKYTVVAEKSGYKTSTTENVEIVAGSMYKLDLVLVKE